MKTTHPIAPIIYAAGAFFATVALFTNALFAEPSRDTAINPGATVDGLRLEANVRLIEHAGEKQLYIRAFLVNEGTQDVTVLTKLPGPSMSRDAKGLMIGFDYTGRTKSKGRLIIPSLNPNEPVTLRPGEVAMLTARRSSESFVDPLKGGEEIRVGYFVTDEWGKRFDLWHGYVCAVVSVDGIPSRPASSRTNAKPDSNASVKP